MRRFVVMFAIASNWLSWRLERESFFWSCLRTSSTSTTKTFRTNGWQSEHNVGKWCNYLQLKYLLYSYVKGTIVLLVDPLFLSFFCFLAFLFILLHYYMCIGEKECIGKRTLWQLHVFFHLSSSLSFFLPTTLGLTDARAQWKMHVAFCTVIWWIVFLLLFKHFANVEIRLIMHYFCCKLRWSNIWRYIPHNLCSPFDRNWILPEIIKGKTLEIVHYCFLVMI